ncbi:MAG: hypothetical protein Q7R78_01105 [bacterium]|nr:hypothetical protein [bacterium]
MFRFITHGFSATRSLEILGQIKKVLKEKLPNKDFSQSVLEVGGNICTNFDLEPERVDYVEIQATDIEELTKVVVVLSQANLGTDLVISPNILLCVPSYTTLDTDWQMPGQQV